MSDLDQFIAKINQKEDAGYRELYQRFYAALSNYATKIVGDPLVAQDIVQEAYIRIWEGQLYFPDIQSLAAYLYRSVYTRSLNLIRDTGTSQKAYQKWKYSTLEQYDKDNEEFAVEFAVEENAIAKFREVLTHLSAQQREILILSIEGLKVKEIADKLQLSENSVKTQKKRAYTTVRELLGCDLGLFIFLLFS